MQTTQDLRIQQLEKKHFESIRTTTRYVREILAEECRNFKNKMQDTGGFPELVILVVFGKGNAALSDVQ